MYPISRSRVRPRVSLYCVHALMHTLSPLVLSKHTTITRSESRIARAPSTLAHRWFALLSCCVDEATELLQSHSYGRHAAVASLQQSAEVCPGSGAGCKGNAVVPALSLLLQCVGCERDSSGVPLCSRDAESSLTGSEEPLGVLCPFQCGESGGSAFARECRQLPQRLQREELCGSLQLLLLCGRLLLLQQRGKCVEVDPWSSMLVLCRLLLLRQQMLDLCLLLLLLLHEDLYECVGIHRSCTGGR